ncbi:retinal homeobox protein Rx-A-like [Bolinopsis microptera]
MMAKRMKLSFSIDQILGLHETLKQEAAEEDEKERCTLKEERLDLASPGMDNRLTAEYRSPSLPSPGSDGFNDCSDDDFKNRKRKRTRTTFSSAQVYELEKKFQRCQYLSAVDRLNLAAALSMSDVQVKRWFQNRRCKERHRAEDLQKIQRSPLLFYQQPYLGAAADALILQNHIRTLVQLGNWSTPS